ncbi:MAG: hypothetical protein LAN70_16445 [Acidobacteriia bacterium]|nr:hypothetical protein [Terriglobia bacterium]
MIFGFNTDVRFADTVYHVQSEARQHELVLQTLVFVKGRCIGKRTASYAEQTKQPGFSEEHMHEMLKDQHKHFVAAVREGRIEAELGERSEHAQAEAPPPAAAAHIAEFAIPAVAAADTASQPEEPDTVVIEPEMMPAAVAAAPDTAPVDDLAAQFAAAVASKPVDPGLSLIPAGTLMGKGLSLECRPPAAGADASALTIGVEIGDEDGPAAGAQISCRITSGKTHANYLYATTNADGVADVQLALKDLDLSATALLIQASHRGKSASRKYKLQTSS